MKQLDRKKINLMVDKNDSTGNGGGNSTVQPSYTLPQASSTTLGGIKLGYQQNGKFYPVQLDQNGRAYVNATWPDKISAFTNDSGYITSAGTAAKANALTVVSKTAWGQTYWTSGGVPTDISGDMSDVGNIQCGSGKRIYGTSDLYIGDSGNAYYVKFSDLCSQDGIGYWVIRQSGSATFANVLSNGYVTALSDIRMKKVIGRFSLKLEAIAYASIIQFTWKEGDTKTKRVGGIAQEWQEILPDAVIEDECGRLAMDYGAISYVSVVSLARRVVAQQKTLNEQQKRINELKAANDNLEKRLTRLERLFGMNDSDSEE